MKIITSSINKTVSSTAYVYSDPINLTSDAYRGCPVFVKCDVIGGESTASFDINAIWSETSGGTYASFITGSGSSKVIEGGTTGALYSAGSYFVPLTVVPYSGVTLAFKGTGFLKLGSISTNCDFDLRLDLVI
jgi:hypothetical protein